MSKIILMPDVRLAPMLRVHAGGLTNAFQNKPHQGVNAPELAAEAESHWQKFGFGLYTVFSGNAKVMGYVGAQHWVEEEAYDGILELHSFIDKADNQLRIEILEKAIDQTLSLSGDQTCVLQATFGKHSNLSRATIDQLNMTTADYKISHKGHKQQHAVITPSMHLAKNN